MFGDRESVIGDPRGAFSVATRAMLTSVSLPCLGSSAVPVDANQRQIRPPTQVPKDEALRYLRAARVASGGLPFESVSSSAVERVLLDPVEAAADQQKVLSVKELRLHLDRVTVHLAIED